MLQISQLNILYEKDSPAYRKKKLAGKIHILPSEIVDMTIVKKSLDARKKPDIYVTYTIRFSVRDEDRVLAGNRGRRNLIRVEEDPSLWTYIRHRQKNMPSECPRVVVVGAGPAGLFCSYYLSLCGCQPVLIERGAPVEERMDQVEGFWRGHRLDPESNVSFGEGGAGTFSDGKLNTGVKDHTGRKQFVLESFVRFGAREDILYDAKPHMGTDILRSVVRNMREELLRLGCGIRFHTKMTEIIKENGRVTGIRIRYPDLTGKFCEEMISCDKLVLAVGHSARDTFAMLKDCEVAMSPKAFAVGMRVQHRQGDIDFAQYGTAEGRFPAASYKCTGKTGDGRGVYSFCMCPGGYVVNASSETGRLVVNGMSDADRDSGNANSAIVVSVGPEDFEGTDVLAGVEFQRRWEETAYRLCQGKIPVQRYGDFKNNQKTERAGKVKPCVKGKWEFANLYKSLPNYVINGMIEGIEQFGQRISGFADEDTLLMGIETRTSSPVRIDRGDDFVSLSTQGLYPCGEGAGYAGGIMSAAMDGLKVAMGIVQAGAADREDTTE